MEQPARHSFKISPEQLLVDLYRAYKDARRHKRGKGYQLKFEYRLEDNMVALRDDIFYRRYKPRPSTCFVIHDPKMREVFAGDFRDRIVHHLFYNYTAELFERTFIADSYSCIKGRGTHYGIGRLKHHIRSVSRGYSRPAYVMKIDIRGYFMHIDRRILLDIARERLGSMRSHRSGVQGKTWGEVIDYDLTDYLLESIISTDPTDSCHIIGQKDDWTKLPRDKSIFCSSPGCGLPIGNLSSQLFSNVYMNEFDQYMKRVARCRHYGRYVDDCYVVGASREQLKSLIPGLISFLSERLHIEVNVDKLAIINVAHGVEFLGAYIKPFRTYIASGSLARIDRKMQAARGGSRRRMRSSINSFLGVFSHYDSYRLRRVLFGYRYAAGLSGHFSGDWLRYDV